MEKLPWNPYKDLIRVPANNLGIDIDRAIYVPMAIGYSRQSMEQAKKNDIVKFGMGSVSRKKAAWHIGLKQKIPTEESESRLAAG